MKINNMGVMIMLQSSVKPPCILLLRAHFKNVRCERDVNKMSHMTIERRLSHILSTKGTSNTCTPSLGFFEPRSVTQPLSFGFARSSLAASRAFRCSTSRESLTARAFLRSAARVCIAASSTLCRSGYSSLADLRSPCRWACRSEWGSGQYCLM